MKIKAQVSTKLSKETLMHIDYGLLVTIYVAKDEESGEEELLSVFARIPGEEADISTMVPNKKEEIDRWKKLLSEAGTMTVKIERIQRSKEIRDTLLREAKEGIDIR